MKATDPDQRGSSLYRPQPDGFNASGVTLARLIEYSCELYPFQLEGEADWVRNQRFTIAAKYPQGWTLEAGGYAEAMQMAQRLLADRFKLRVHKETQERTLYRMLTVREDRRVGPKLRPTTDSCGPGSKRDEQASGTAKPFPCMTYTTPRSLQINGRDLTFIASHLSRILGAAIVNETNLAGLYDLQLDWTAGPTSISSDECLSIFTAIREQLGLKLERGRGPVEVWVIDAAERPTPN